MSTISIVIPNYNRERLIGETLECLLQQSRPADEVIVVDDGSTDGSVDVIRQFCPRVKLIRQANAGPGPARNAGLVVATGEFIQFFDSDDLCSRNKLEVQLRALVSTESDFAYCPWLMTQLAPGTAVSEGPLIQAKGLPDRRSALSWFLEEWTIVFQCCLFRRALFDRVGPYRTDLMPTEDSELLFRILKAGAKGVHTPDCLVLYRLHDGAQISRGGIPSVSRVRDWLHYVELVAHQLETEGVEAPWAARMSWEIVRFDALRRARALMPDELAAHPDLPPGKKALLATLSSARRFRKGLARRMRGNDLGPAYQPGRLTEVQGPLIEALGYLSPASVDPGVVARDAVRS